MYSACFVFLLVATITCQDVTIDEDMRVPEISNDWVSPSMAEEFDRDSFLPLGHQALDDTLQASVEDDGVFDENLFEEKEESASQDSASQELASQDLASQDLALQEATSEEEDQLVGDILDDSIFASDESCLLGLNATGCRDSACGNHNGHDLRCSHNICTCPINADCSTSSEEGKIALYGECSNDKQCVSGMAAADVGSCSQPIECVRDQTGVAWCHTCATCTADGNLDCDDICSNDPQDKMNDKVKKSIVDSEESSLDVEDKVGSDTISSTSDANVVFNGYAILWTILCLAGTF